MASAYDEKVAGNTDVSGVPVDIESVGKDSTTVNLKTNKNGVVLVPQPSDDPEDPLVSLQFISPS
jgi:hypothetical protein